MSWLGLSIIISILYFRFILHLRIRNNFNMFSTWILSNLHKFCSLFHLMFLFKFFLFSLSLGSLFSLCFLLLLFSQLKSSFLCLLLKSLNFLSLFFSKLLSHKLLLLLNSISFLNKLFVFLHLFLLSFFFKSSSSLLSLSFLKSS